MTDVLRIANCSGFYGDRLSAAREMVEGGPIDVLTGDYLAELTLMILLKDRLSDTSLGYARTFLRQLEEVAATCTRARHQHRRQCRRAQPGGLRRGGARALRRSSALTAVVAHIEGDDLMPKLAALQAAGETLDAPRPRHPAARAAAAGAERQRLPRRLGHRRGARARRRRRHLSARHRRGARASGRRRGSSAGSATTGISWPRRVVAGHIIECGAQCTGGNYTLLPGGAGARRIRASRSPRCTPTARSSSPSMPAPAASSRSAPSRRSCSTRSGPRYLNPDVTARFDTIQLDQEGPDRVLVHGMRGEPPPPTTKVCINYLGGYKNSMTFVLAGLDIEEKARAGGETLWKLVGGREQFAEAQRHAAPRRSAGSGLERGGVRLPHDQR